MSSIEQIRITTKYAIEGYQDIEYEELEPNKIEQ